MDTAVVVLTLHESTSVTSRGPATSPTCLLPSPPSSPVHPLWVLAFTVSVWTRLCAGRHMSSALPPIGPSLSQRPGMRKWVFHTSQKVRGNPSHYRARLRISYPAWGAWGGPRADPEPRTSYGGDSQEVAGPLPAHLLPFNTCTSTPACCLGEGSLGRRCMRLLG